MTADRDALYLKHICEAAKQLSPELRQSSAHVRWRDLAGMRDKLIHHYFGVDLRAVWATAALEVPDLLVSATRLLPDHGQTGE